ncbi:hypothetical protein ACFE04_026701 [Oxalis oulophora]
MDHSLQILQRLKEISKHFVILLSTWSLLTFLTAVDVPILYSRVPFQNAALSTPEAPTIAATIYLRMAGRPPVLPSSNLTYSEKFLGDKSFKPIPRLARVIDVLFILHAEHEMNCFTTAARHLASRKHKMSGFGHRLYKNYDPRAKVIRKLVEEVFSIVGRDPLIEIFFCELYHMMHFTVVVALEKAALSDEYFIKRKAMGFPPEFFTVLFAIPRMDAMRQIVNENDLHLLEANMGALSMRLRVLSALLVVVMRADRSVAGL